MDGHDFDRSPALFTILTAGKGEDGWTPRANGMINCAEQIRINNLGFLIKGPSDEVSHTQREGRVGRVTHSLYLHLDDPIEPSDTWVMPYPELLKVRLAAMDLEYTKEIPGLSAAQRREAEADLVQGDIVFKIGVVWDSVGTPFFLSFGNPCMAYPMRSKAGYQPPRSFCKECMVLSRCTASVIHPNCPGLVLAPFWRISGFVLASFGFYSCLLLAFFWFPSGFLLSSFWAPPG